MEPTSGRRDNNPVDPVDPVDPVYILLQFFKLEIRVTRGVAKLRFVTDGAFSWPDEQVYHSTLLMALSRIEGLVWMAKEEPHMDFKHPSVLICVPLLCVLCASSEAPQWRGKRARDNDPANPVNPVEKLFPSLREAGFLVGVFVRPQSPFGDCGCVSRVSW